MNNKHNNNDFEKQIKYTTPETQKIFDENNPMDFLKKMNQSTTEQHDLLHDYGSENKREILNKIKKIPRYMLELISRYFSRLITKSEKVLSSDNDINKGTHLDMQNNVYSELLDEIKNIKLENKLTNARIDNTNKIIGIVGTVLGLILTVFIFASNSQYNAIRDMNNANMQYLQTEFKSINKRLDYQEQLNKLNIQNDVKNETIMYKLNQK